MIESLTTLIAFTVVAAVFGFIGYISGKIDTADRARRESYCLDRPIVLSQKLVDRFNDYGVQHVRFSQYTSITDFDFNQILKPMLCDLGNECLSRGFTAGYEPDAD